MACGTAGASSGDVPLILDHYALFYIGLIIAATFAIAILCYGYLAAPHGDSRRTLCSAPGGNARFDGSGGEQPLHFFLSWT